MPQELSTKCTEPVLYNVTVTTPVAEPAANRKSMLKTDHLVPLTIEKAKSLTVSFSDCNLHKFMQLAADFDRESYGYVVTPNTDHLIRYCDDASFRELYRTAAFVLLDSRFLAYVLRLVTGVKLPTSPGSDVTEMLFRDVMEPDDKVIVVGGSEQQADTLRERYGLRNLSHFNPPMGFIKDPLAVESVLQYVENEGPFRFCLLAVGSPQQEVLAQALFFRGRARGLALCVGASINFLTGGERRAPKWIQYAGMEWFFRLASDPMRMAKRYLVRGPRIFFMLPRLKFILKPVSVSSDPVKT